MTKAERQKFAPSLHDHVRQLSTEEIESVMKILITELCGAINPHWRFLMAAMRELRLRRESRSCL